MNEAVWKEILDTARWAPSAYNAQPWRFHIVGGTLTLLSRPERWRPVIDPKNRETLISLGALAHSLRVAASGAGYALEEEWLLSSPVDVQIARFSLIETDAPAGLELEALLGVRTWRRGYRHEPISSAKLQAIDDLLGEYGAVAVKGSAEFKTVVDATVEAAVLHARSEEIYAELSPYLYHPQRKRDHSWGVVSPISERKGVREFFWNRLSNSRTALRKGYRASTITDSRDLLHQAPALVLLQGDHTNPYDLIEVGSRYQRLRLEAFRLGLATQPLSILPQMVNDGRMELEDGVEKIQLLIRLGVPMETKKAPRSVREPVETLLKGSTLPEGDAFRAA